MDLREEAWLERCPERAPEALGLDRITRERESGKRGTEDSAPAPAKKREMRGE